MRRAATVMVLLVLVGAVVAIDPVNLGPRGKPTESTPTNVDPKLLSAERRLEVLWDEDAVDQEALKLIRVFEDAALLDPEERERHLELALSHPDRRTALEVIERHVRRDWQKIDESLLIHADIQKTSAALQAYWSVATRERNKLRRVVRVAGLAGNTLTDSVIRREGIDIRSRPPSYESARLLLLRAMYHGYHYDPSLLPDVIDLTEHTARLESEMFSDDTLPGWRRQYVWNDLLREPSSAITDALIAKLCSLENRETSEAVIYWLLSAETQRLLESQIERVAECADREALQTYITDHRHARLLKAMSAK